MQIEVGIPWEPERRLGAAANRFMSRIDDWGLILDWDVSLLNIHWYDICLRAVKHLGHSAGLISCVTNRIGCPLQKAPGAPAGDDMEVHREFARKVEQDYAGQVRDVTWHERWKLSGMFFLTHREAWDQVGGAPGGKFIGFDNWYHDRVRELGYRIHVLQDLYVYHGYRRLWRRQGAQE